MLNTQSRAGLTVFVPVLLTLVAGTMPARAWHGTDIAYFPGPDDGTQGIGASVGAHQSENPNQWAVWADAAIVGTFSIGYPGNSGSGVMDGSLARRYFPDYDGEPDSFAAENDAASATA